MSVGASAASRTSNLSRMRLCICLSIFALFPASNSSFSPLWQKEAIIIDSLHRVAHLLCIVTLQVTIALIEGHSQARKCTSQSHRSQQHRPMAPDLRLTAG